MLATTTAAALLLQQTVVAGVVRDSVSLTPLEGARVTVERADDARSATRVTDSYGAFVIAGVDEGPGGIHLSVELPGYAPWERALDPLPEGSIPVLLAALPVELQGLDVSGGGVRPRNPLSAMREGYVVDRKLAEAVPALLEADVMRVAELSPAASSPSDFAPVPYIRGVPSYGTPVLLDGVRIFNPINFLGLFSSLAPEAIERLEVVPGSAGEGIGAGSLAGTMRVSSRDGSRDRVRTVAAIGVASAGAKVEGPLGDDKSFLVTGRRAYVDVFTRGLERLGWVSEDTPYYFQDLHARLTADLGGLERFSVNAYLSKESRGLEIDCPALIPGGIGSGTEPEVEEWRQDERDWEWSNGAVSAQYRRRLWAGGVLDATLGHSWFRDASLDLGSCHYLDRYPRPPYPDTVELVDGRMRETRAEVRATWGGPRATMVVAVQASGFAVDHETYGASRYGTIDVDGRLGRLAAYLSVDAPVGARLVARSGLRADHFVGLESTTSGYAEVSYDLGDWSARVAASRSRQALGSLRNEETRDAVTVAFDILFPVPESPVPSSTELVAGLGGSLRGVHVRIDGYLRELDHLRLGADPFLFSAFVDSAELESASGSMRGLEVAWSLVRSQGLSVLGGYRWAWVEYDVQSRGGYKPRPLPEWSRGSYTPRFHRDHELELAPSFRHGYHTWSVRVSLRSGIGIRYPEGHYDVERGGRLPMYHRVDVGWGRDVGSWAIRASVANLLLNVNALGYWYYGRPDRTAREDGFALLPFLKAEFRW